MKTTIGCLAVLASLTLLFTGCGKPGDNGAVGVDPSPMEKSFATAETAVKEAANTAVAAIKKADYSSALAQLQTLAGNVKLTEEQQTAISHVIDQVKKAIAGTAEKAAGEANKAVGEMQKKLGQ